MASKKLRTGVKGKNRASVNGTAAGPAFTIGAKAKAALLTIGAGIANAEINKGQSVLDALYAAKGKRPEEIAIIREGNILRWKQHMAELTPKERDRVIMGVRSRESEEKAVLRFFENAYGMTEAQQKRHYAALGGLGYHATVSYCRKVNASLSGNAGGGNDKRRKNGAARALAAWNNKPEQRMKEVQDNVRFAPLAALRKLEAFVKKMIAIRGRIEAKGMKEQKPAAIVAMLRKAA